MQHYNFLCATVMICATVVNIQRDTHIDVHTHTNSILIQLL